MARVLLLNSKTLGRYMAGPGIRVWELAKALAVENDVTISVPLISELAAEKIKITKRSTLSLLREILISKIVIAPIYSLDLIWLLVAKLLRKKIVIDAYFIPLFENSEKYQGAEKAMVVKVSNLRTKFLLLIGDRFLCASQRQSEYWQQLLLSFGRKNKIDLLPTGIPEKGPVQTRKLIKGVVSGISNDDKVILWSSGIWSWLDPISAIKAIILIPDSKVKLVFFGLNPMDEHFKGGGGGKAAKAVALARESGLIDKRVFFVYDRVPYNEVANYLLEADVAVNLHHDHMETRYAFRTRLLDYIWAGIPVVTTKGDVLAEIIAGEKMGILVDYEAEAEIANAIMKLLQDNQYYVNCRKNMKRYAAGMTWQQVSLPLRLICSQPDQHGDGNDWLAIISTLSRFYFWSAIYLFKKLVLRAYS